MTTGFGQARQLIEIIQAPVDLGAVVAGEREKVLDYLFLTWPRLSM